jgi:hypothetical protein
MQAYIEDLVRRQTRVQVFFQQEVILAQGQPLYSVIGDLSSLSNEDGLVITGTNSSCFVPRENIAMIREASGADVTIVF